MIKYDDLLEAIAECEGELNPTANTCIKLAAFYTIRDHLYGEQNATYSFSPPPQKSYESETEFAKATAEMTRAEMMPILDELMETIQVIHPRLYESAMRKFKEKY